MISGGLRKGLLVEDARSFASYSASQRCSRRLALRSAGAEQARGDVRVLGGGDLRLGAFETREQGLRRASGHVHLLCVEERCDRGSFQDRCLKSKAVTCPSNVAEI